MIEMLPVECLSERAVLAGSACCRSGAAENGGTLVICVEKRQCYGSAYRRIITGYNTDYSTGTAIPLLNV